MEYKVTILHDEIKAWIKKHGGKPAVIETQPNYPGVLRIKFGDQSMYKEISFAEFFDRFESEGLAFRYIDHVIKGNEELSFTFLNRKVVEDQKDDMTELPEDNKMAKENLFPS